MRRIVLVRHSVPETGGVKMCLGSGTDPGLSREGAALCAETEKLLRSVPADNIYSSPLARARRTAELLFPGRKAAVIADLREIYMGAWDGLSFDEIKRGYPDLYARRGEDPSLLPPGSESWEEVSERMERAVLSTEGNCIAVSHAGAIKSLILKIRGCDFRSIGSFKLGYCSMTTLFEDSGILYTEEQLSKLS